MAANVMRPISFLLCLLVLTVKSWATDSGPVAERILPPLPPREFRAAWIATVANIDWPSKPGLPVAQQKAELISLLDRAAQLHFNAIFFQVRSVGDAMYPSVLEPWSEYITGIQGHAPVPFYDPLALAIAEAHKRGLELHAWFNPFRAGHPDSKSSPAPNHVTRTHPELVRRYAREIFLDPGEPETQNRALAVIQDVINRYDVDGVVMDDYFYPYPEKNRAGQELDFPDEVSWKKYGLRTGLSRAAWRRENVNRFIHKLSVAVKATKPWVQFGVSPFGIWRPQNPAPIRGMDSYDKIFADSRKWLVNGWVDYLSPQLYWSVASSQQSFPLLFDWWRAQNVHGRHLWPALADASAGGKFSMDEITHQVQIIRQRSDPGEVHYHLRSVLDNPALAAAVGTQYAQPALVPASPWIDAVPPPSPKLFVDTMENSAHVRWENGIGKYGAGKLVNWWVLQVRTGGTWNSMILPGVRSDFYLNQVKPDTIVIRAVDRIGNVSEPAVWIPRKYATPAIIKGGTLIKASSTNSLAPKKIP